MNNRVEKLKRKMDARRKNRKYTPHNETVRKRSRDGEMYPISWRHEDDREDPPYVAYEHRKSEPYRGEHSYFRKDRFFMQVLASICFFIAMAIVFQSPSQSFSGIKSYVERSFEEEFQFDVVANWYEGVFGKPLALLPSEMDVVAPQNFEEEKNDVYALPANGVVRQSFEQNGRGIYVETDVKEQVEAVRSGMVRFVGEDEEKEWGKIVVVRHYDGGESWYGMLENISVQLYDHVESGEVLGEVSTHSEKESVGVYYFALKNRDTFIDPIEVITFD